MRKWRISGAKATICYFILSTLLAWGVALPLWNGQGLQHPYFVWIAMAIMFTPALAAFIVSVAEGRAKTFATEVGLWPIVRPMRFAVCLGLAVLLPVLLIVQAPIVGTWLGVFPGDLKNFLVLKFAAGSDGTTKFLLEQGGLILLGGLINLLPALGEEIGWRGWLWPRLQILGQVPAIVISGVVWGLWHAPLVLLGYNYPLAKDGWGVVWMCGMCIVVGAFFAWLRTISGSVWPAALAHAIFNASAGLVALFMMMGMMLDTRTGSILGWSGWIVPAVVIAIMVVAGAFRRRKQPEDIHS